MSIENLHPYAGDHAVQNAIFVVEWAEPLKSEAIIHASKLATKFRNSGLGEINLQNTLALKIGDPVNNVPHIQDDNGLGAVIFSKKTPMGEAIRSVTISRENCMIVISDYSNWDSVFADVQQYLKLALEDIAPLRPINVIGLQYNDSFSWKDDPSELNLREIFNENAYIPKYTFSQTGLWHVHTGYMEALTQPIEHTRLENINVNLADLNGERTIQIVGSSRAQLKSPLWQAHLKNKQQMINMFDVLHALNKQTLKKLLTIDLCRKIKLVE